jgi:hypothetical protein
LDRETRCCNGPTATTPAGAEEFHNQAAHIWFTTNELGGGLQLRFDFGVEFDIGTLHFWNYTSEDFDVDSIVFTFFNVANSEVGSLALSPALGSSPGIRAQDIVLAAPLNVRYVTAFLSGSNRQVDFQNIGFTAEVSDPEPPSVPEPGTLGLLALGLLGMSSRFRAMAWKR